MLYHLVDWWGEKRLENWAYENNDEKLTDSDILGLTGKF